MGYDNAAACNRELGAELRKRREAAGVAGAAVADYTGWDRSKISRIESGQIGVSPVDALYYLGACQVWAPDAKEILDLCETAQRKLGYWLSPKGERLDRMFSTLTFHESTATSLTLYDPHVVNGLLQTRDYARALFSRESRRDADDVAHCVDLRIARQQILNRPRPAKFTFFVHETALRREVGGRDVQQEQLLHVVLLAALPHVTLRVIPASTEAPSAGGPFQLFNWSQHRPLIYLDNQPCGFFLEDDELVTPIRDLIQLIATAAMDEARSREWVASLANELDRANEEYGTHGLEEGHRQ